MFAEWLDLYHFTLDIVVITLVVAGQYDNHLWRILCTVLSYLLLEVLLPIPSLAWYLWPVFALAIMKMPHLRRRQPFRGCVLVTGCDSGMGQATVVHLAVQNQKLKKRNKKSSFDRIFACAFDAVKATQDLQQLIKEHGGDVSVLRVIPLDVTSDDSVASAKKSVEDELTSMGSGCLVSMVCFHGVGYNGPAEFMPLEMFQRQFDVNFVGNIRMAQAFLPLIRKGVEATVATQGRGRPHRGRIVFTGTGGGPCSPCPTLLSAYMSSKFACEAFAQSLKMELYMSQASPAIDVSVINPGFVKPTMLIAEGAKLTERMWAGCEKRFGDTRAKDEFGRMMKHFNEYSAATPGTHVSNVAKAAEHALTAHSPRSSYKVGIDSKLAPIVGMLPTGPREWMARNGIYGLLSPVGTLQGYNV